ncbi:hypothetical protein BH18ACT2_BH18ACT2_03390 [soil metagenome]
MGLSFFASLCSGHPRPRPEATDRRGAPSACRLDGGRGGARGAAAGGVRALAEAPRSSRRLIPARLRPATRRRVRQRRPMSMFLRRERAPCAFAWWVGGAARHCSRDAATFDEQSQRRSNIRTRQPSIPGTEPDPGPTSGSREVSVVDSVVVGASGCSPPGPSSLQATSTSAKAAPVIQGTDLRAIPRLPSTARAALPVRPPNRPRCLVNKRPGQATAGRHVSPVTPRKQWAMFDTTSSTRGLPRGSGDN